MMDSMIDDAYRIVDKAKTGIKFDDLYNMLAQERYFNTEQYLENKSDFFNELCLDNRFQRNGNKWYSHNLAILRTYTTKLDDFVMPNIDSTTTFSEVYIEALKEEIAHSYLSRKRYRLEDGIRLDTKNIYHSYSFKLEENLNFPHDSIIIVDKDENHYFGKVVLCDDSTLIFNTSQNFGNEIKNIEIAMDSSQLLDALIERLDELNCESSILQTLILKGFNYINDLEVVTGQENAVAHAYSNPISFIWGPPGTGKTTTLAKIVIDNLKRGKRVLMVSQSNVSVDGALMRVIQDKDNEFPVGSIIRYGYPKNSFLVESDIYNSYRYVLSRDPSLYHEFIELKSEMKNLDFDNPRLKEVAERLNQIQMKFKEDEDLLIHSASFVATTITKATVSKSIYEQQFDIVLFDEASMAYVPQVVFAASLASNHFVCLGDYQQLPAIAFMKDSVLTYDIFRYVGIEKAIREGRNHDWLCLLDVQRRMHPTIADFVSENMYFGLLKSSYDMQESTKKIVGLNPFSNHPICCIDLSGTYSVCTKTYDSSYINALSAFISVSLAKKYENIDVGIITPYNAQARLIRSMIEDLKLNNVVCSTVHQFQGSEKSVIIFDAVDCYMRKFANDLLTSDRLINVAISRAKGKFIFIGNLDYLNEKVSKTKRMICNLLKYVKKGNLVQTRQEILNTISSDENILTMDVSDIFKKFMNDLKISYEEVCIDLHGGFNSDFEKNEIGKVLNDLFRNGIKISVRFDMNTSIPEDFKLFSENSYQVINTITIIDNKNVWFNVPNNKGGFKYTNTNQDIVFKPSFNIQSKRSAKSFLKFLGIHHGNNEYYSLQNLKLDRRCPICRHQLIQQNSSFIRCSNKECNYHEKVEYNMSDANTNVLCVEVDENIEICEDYKICHIPFKNNFAYPKYIALKNERGFMKMIYLVKCVYEINPKYIKKNRTFSLIELNVLEEYIEEMEDETNELQFFYFLEPFRNISKNNVQIGHTLQWLNLEELL